MSIDFYAMQDLISFNLALIALTSISSQHAYMPMLKTACGGRSNFCHAVVLTLMLDFSGSQHIKFVVTGRQNVWCILPSEQNTACGVMMHTLAG
jgi:hypothetical protein